MSLTDRQLHHIDNTILKLVEKYGFEVVFDRVMSMRVLTAYGLNLRALGTNPRALGISPRQLRARGQL